VNASNATLGSKRDFVALLFLALAYRLVFLLAMPRVIDTADAVHYLETARALAQGDVFGYDPKIPFFYPLLGALASFVIHDLEWACRIVSFVASVLLIVPVYGLTRALHGIAAARLAAAAVAIWPWFADYGCRVSTESTAVFLWLTLAWLAPIAMRRGGGALAWAIAAGSALAWTRAEGVFVFGVAVAAAAFIARTTPGAWRRWAIFAGAFIVWLVVNTIYTRQLTGAATASYRLGFIVQEFEAARFAHTALSASSDVLPVMLGPVLLVFLGVGLFRPRPEPRDARAELFVLAVAATQWLATASVLSPAPRYLMAPIAVLAGYASYGIVVVTRQLAASPQTAKFRALPALALFAFLLLHTGVTVGAEWMGERPREPREYKIAGEWMREHLEPGLVFTRKPQVAWYAGMASTGPAVDDSLADALKRAEEAGAAYIVVDQRYAVPGMRPLLDSANPPPPLELLFEFDAIPEARIVVYGWADSGAP